MSGSFNNDLMNMIKDFVFDLHDATRRSYRLDDVQQLYDNKFKEIAEKYLSHAMWPNEETVASECEGDEIFLLFYRELTLRHFFAKQKHIQVAPYLESWKTYSKLFDLLIANPDSFIAITPQWAYDIVQEFVYQFQSFSQYRSQHQDSSGEDGKLLEANQTAWSLPAVTFLLSRAVRLTTSYPPSGSIHYLIGYFSIIELSRVECLVCDYSSSYQTAATLLTFPSVSSASSSSSSSTPAITTTSSTPSSELYTTVFQAHLNFFYHTGISLLMLRKYSDVIELYTNITYQITRLSKQLGTNTKSSSATSANSTISSYNKIGDKIISLIAVVSSLSPNIPLDDYICDLMTMKLGDKLRRLRAGEISLYRDFFESSVPKFVSPVISSSVPISSTDIRYTQLDNFLQDVRQQLEFITIRRYLKLYTTVSVDKIASFVDMNSEQFLARLLALKSQNSQDDSLQFHIVDGDTIVIDHSGGSAGKGNGKTSSAEVKRYYMNGIRKNSDLWNETERLFKKLQF